MRSAARKPEQDAPPEPAREDPRIRADALAARFEAVLAALEDGGNGDLMFEVIVLGRQYAEHAAAMKKLLAAQHSEDAAFAAGVALGERRAAAAQGAPGPRRPSGRACLNVVRALAPAGAIGIAVKTWAAHRVLTPVALAAMVGVPAVAVTMAPARTAPYYASTAPAPAASIYSAVPVAATGTPRAEPQGAAAGSRPLVSATPRARVPSASPPASRPPAPPASSSPAAFLTVSTREIDLGEYMSATLSVAAPAGAVAWSASCTPGVSLSSSAGTLAAGQQGYQLTVRKIAAGGEKDGWCTFWPGGTRVLVTWA